jgi:hypothetical protein
MSVCRIETIGVIPLPAAIPTVATVDIEFHASGLPASDSPFALAAFCRAHAHTRQR